MVANSTKYNKLVASMSNLMHCFSAIAGSIREKAKMGPRNEILVKYVFDLRGTVGGKKLFTSIDYYIHETINIAETRCITFGMKY